MHIAKSDKIKEQVATRNNRLNMKTSTVVQKEKAHL